MRVADHSQMSSIRLDAVTKAYGSSVVASGVTLDVAEGEFVTLLGGSGSGKTTCLRIVAGFLAPDRGRVYIGGRDVTNVPAHRRDTGMVFQSYALFPHLTVAQNVAYGLRVRRLPRADVSARTAKALALVRLEAFADRYPAELSGGQRQRVALARAVVIQPKVLLLDEPLGALDLKLRQELQGEIKRIQQTLGITTLFVTHDQGEALGLSDRIVVMRDGRVLQIDTPDAVYRRPASRYVADFVGRMNFFEAVVHETIDGDRYRLTLARSADGVFEAATNRQRSFATGERCLVGVRPEDMELSSGGATNAVAARVVRTTYVGNAWSLECASDANADMHVVLPARCAVPEPGTAVVVRWAPDACVLLADD